MDIFCRRLKEALNQKKMTSIELANKLGINRGIISNYINGKYKPKMDRLTKIANVLNVNEAWLMGYDFVSAKELDANELYIEIVKLLTISSIPTRDKEKITQDIEYILLK